MLKEKDLDGKRFWEIADSEPNGNDGDRGSKLRKT